MTHNERVFALLSDGKPHTHHEVYGLHVIGHSRVADLRRQGHNIACWQETRNGERVSVYRLIPSLEEADTANILPVADPPSASSSETEQLSLGAVA